jgi:5-methylcytosine-specific restriction endonuclease McrA
MTNFLFPRFNNRTDLVNFLKSQRNEYSLFILERLSQSSFDSLTGTEIHHIIPRYAGGPNTDWNLIRLTFDQHTEAHLLLYTV